jgi:peptidyl-dipeptidase Dcp
LGAALAVDSGLRRAPRHARLSAESNAARRHVSRSESSMKALLALTMAVTVPSAFSLAAPANSPATSALSAPWPGPYGGVPPWDQVKPADFPAAFTAAIEEYRREINAIAQNPAQPTFANTLVAMERAGETLRRVTAMFGVYQSNLSTPEVQALDLEWSPKLAAAADEVKFNEKLFARISTVHATRGDAGLDAVDTRLLERTYNDFVRTGAKLDANGKQRLGAINQRLAALFADFSARVLKDEETWIVLGAGDLGGLSPSLVASFKAAAEERGINDGWAVVNTRSSVDPFLTFSDSRALREKVWRAFKNRGDNGGANDTNALIVEITGLRAERARLLGYPTHAHLRTEDTMARTPENAEQLMAKVWAATTKRVQEEVADMQALAAKQSFAGQIEPWDYLYYAEKVRTARYAVNQDDLKPYFELNNMIAAAFHTAQKLYGLQFKEITGTVPVFHPDVRVWEVREQDGRYIGLFYGDNFARTGKRSGAWMTGYRYHEAIDAVRTPLVSNNNNFVKGAAGEPVLISLDDATTLFHEFGHALHFLLSNAKYLGLSDTPGDYVELPSQVLESWVLTRPILDQFARHYKTGEAMPQALVDKVRAASKFNQGYATAEYLSAAIVDMRLHNRPEGISDPNAFERDLMVGIGAPKEVAMRHRLPQFLHLFSSDAYSAGYYSYLWADVMASDAFQAFEEKGNLFDPELAKKMREQILAPLNSSDRAEAYRAFRGRDPEVDALLKRRGFPVENKN